MLSLFLTNESCSHFQNKHTLLNHLNIAYIQHKIFEYTSLDYIKYTSQNIEQTSKDIAHTLYHKIIQNTLQDIEHTSQDIE